MGGGWGEGVGRVGRGVRGEGMGRHEPTWVGILACDSRTSSSGSGGVPRPSWGATLAEGVSTRPLASCRPISPTLADPVEPTEPMEVDLCALGAGGSRLSLLPRRKTDDPFCWSIPAGRTCCLPSFSSCSASGFGCPPGREAGAVAGCCEGDSSRVRFPPPVVAPTKEGRGGADVWGQVVLLGSTRCHPSGIRGTGDEEATLHPHLTSSG